jgi:hypothetical protein
MKGLLTTTESIQVSLILIRRVILTATVIVTGLKLGLNHRRGGLDTSSFFQSQSLIHYGASFIQQDNGWHPYQQLRCNLHSLDLP